MLPVNLLVISAPAASYLRALDKLPAGTKVTISDDPGLLKEAAAEADVLLNCSGKGDRLKEIWPFLRKVRWIHSLSAGVEHQVFSELASSQIPLTNARGVFKESLGEFVIAAALFFAKDFRRMIRNQEAGRWEQFDVEELYRQTMGVVGYGEIGRAAARRGKALGMRVLATRRRASLSEKDEIADETFASEDRGEMISQSDVVVVSTPLTPETRGLIGEAEIARMKPSAIIINVGRGPVIDESALIRALDAKSIRGAALDVFDQEPLPQGHPFWKMENLLLSPHCADHTADWLDQAIDVFIVNFQRFTAGQPLLNVVDKSAGY
jgi:phosphoglycerate dehydrogenase-like enzyme